VEIKVAELRRTFEALSAALSRPSIGSTRWVPPGDRVHLVSSLRELVEQLASTDLETRRALIGTPRQAVHARSREVATALHTLSSRLRAHFATSYTREEIARLRLLLDFPAPDFLRALGRRDDEHSHSDVIAFLLDPRSSPGIALPALERLAQCLTEPEMWVRLFRESSDRDELTVRREVQIGRFWNEDQNALDRIDIVISGRSFVLAIENKVWAREHDRQTTTYWEWLSALPGAKAGIFLSPGGGRATSEHFRSVSYERMAWCFLGENTARSPEEEVMLSAYFKAVFGHVLRNKATMILGMTHEQRNERSLSSFGAKGA
jgi:PD-(D/E)XK nuclease superfamily